MIKISNKVKNKTKMNKMLIRKKKGELQQLVDILGIEVQLLNHKLFKQIIKYKMKDKK